MRAIREQVSSAVDLVVQQARLKDGTRRVVAISEVIGMEGDVITMQDLFLFDFGMGLDSSGRFQGKLKSTGLRPRVLDTLAERGVAVDPTLFSFEKFVR